MHAYCKRLIATVALCCLLFPILVQAQAQPQEKPLAWLGIRSYQRLEQRLREFATMAKAPGLADMALGMIQLQLAGLNGLDRQRPLGLVLANLDLSGDPPVALVLPYTAKEDILGALRNFFPNVQEHKGLLQFQGGASPAFGRLDAASNTLFLAGAPEVLWGLDAALPGDLFANPDSGPDIILRLDVEAVKKREKAMWHNMLGSIEQGRQELLREMEEQLPDNAAEKSAVALMKAYVSLLNRGLQQTLNDLSRGESRITLAPTGWVFELETQMQTGSEAAGFLNQQAGHTSRSAALLSSTAFLRLFQNVRLTPLLRQEMTTLMPLIIQALTAQLSAETTLTAEQRTAVDDGLKLYMAILEQFLAQPQYEAAIEAHLQDGAHFAMTSWSPLPNNTQYVTRILDLADKVLPAFSKEAKIERNAVQHRGAALHHITWPALKVADAPEIPTHMFLGTQGDFLLGHFGPSPEPLKALVDRLQPGTTLTPVRTDALVRMELSLARLAQAKIVQEHMNDAFSATLLEKFRTGPDEPVVYEMLVRQNAAIMRYVFPGALIQIAAEAMGKHITQKIMPGKQEKQPQTPAEKPLQKPQGKSQGKQHQK